jgi:hypothetical protein
MVRRANAGTRVERALERASSFRSAENHGDFLNDTEKDLIVLAAEVRRLRRVGGTR